MSAIVNPCGHVGTRREREYVDTMTETVWQDEVCRSCAAIVKTHDRPLKPKMRLIFEDGRVEETEYSMSNMAYAIDHMRIEHSNPNPPRPIVKEYQLQGRDY